jgi:hypothetical protein
MFYLGIWDGYWMKTILKLIKFKINKILIILEFYLIGELLKVKNINISFGLIKWFICYWSRNITKKLIISFVNNI